MKEDKMKVCGIQMGPFPKNRQNNWYKINKLVEKIMTSYSPNLIAFSELMSSPYIGGNINSNNFNEYAETMEGDTVSQCVDLSLTYDTHVVGTLFEKEYVGHGVNYYNSAFICSPTKGVIGKYRKVHLPKVNSSDLVTDEKYYFEKFGKGGDEFPIFTLDNNYKVGILICFDRSFPEAWRCLSIQGVDLIIVPTATFGFRKDLFIEELKIRAMENNIHVLAVNKSGEERDRDGVRNHFGNSCIIDPFGKIIKEIKNQPWGYLIGDVDIRINKTSKNKIDWLKERKPHIYAKYT